MTRTHAAPLWKDAFEAAAATVSSSRAIIKDFQTICGFGGRFAGTESERRARQYLASRLAEVSGARVEEYPVPYKGWDRGPASVTMVGGPRFAATALGRSPSTIPAGLRAPLIDLGRGTPDDFGRAGKKLSGGIALVRHEYMLALDHIHRRKKYAMAKAAGAAGFLIASGLPGEILVTGSAGSLEPDDIPGAGISMESAKALTDRGGEVDVRVQGQFHDRSAINLVAEIPGRTSELIVLTAHIDGHDLAASAIDNASGLASVLAIAAALRPVVPRLRRGLMIALFNVEEWAVLGSRHFLETLPESKRRFLSFNVNLDSIAGSPNLAVMTSGIPAAEAALASVNEQLGFRLGRHDRFTDNSDHANFIRIGIPALRLCAGLDEPASNLRFLLTTGDTPDKVSSNELRAAARAGIALTLAASEVDHHHLSPKDVSRILSS
jgi:aminopeptidase YwaD